MKRNKPVFNLLLGMAFMCVAGSFQHKVLAQSRSIRLPETCVEGCLENGFRYLILPNAHPSSRVEFRLVLRAGSLLETEEEKGCAHFLEHIAFGGTARFPKRTLVEYLERLGMRYGEDINAYTGFDRTVYMFAVPTDKNRDEVLDNALLIVKEWMEAMSIDEEKVESEKGIILEELRGFDPGDGFYPLKIGNGIFSRRMPLGEAGDIMRMTPAILNGYYGKWYIPSMAALIVVGDISLRETETKIKKVFSALRNPPFSTPLSPIPLSYDKGINMMEIRDTLQTKTGIELIIPHSATVERTVEDAVRHAREALAVRALQARLDARGVDCRISDHWYLADKNHFTLIVEGRDRGELMFRISRIAGEIRYLIERGWEKEELEDVKRVFCRENTPASDFSDRSSGMWCDEFTEYFVSGDCRITDTSQMKEVMRTVESEPGERLQDLLKEWMEAMRHTLLVACTSHPGFGGPLTEEEISASWNKGFGSMPAPYVYVRKKTDETGATLPPACLSASPRFDSACIAEIRKYGNTGIREVVMKNGIRLVLKPTGGSALFLASFAPAGLSSISEEAYPFLEGTAGYMDMGGIAKAGRERLNDFLYEKGISLNTAIENHWHGFIGMASEENAKEFFNLIYEKIFYPELNYKDFEEARRDLLTACGKETLLEKMLKRSSGRALAARMDELTGASLPASYRQPLREDVEKLDLDSIASFYRKLYASPEGTTYVICGGQNADSLIRNFVSVFGSIPFSAAPEFSCPEFRIPEGKTTENFPGDRKDRSDFRFLFCGRYRPGQKNTLLLKLMRNIIRNRLISVLREENSWVYSPYVSLGYEGKPYGTYYFDLDVSANGSNMEKIEKTLLQILERLRSDEISKQELESIKKSFLIAKRETLNADDAPAWRTTLTALLKNGETLEEFDSYERDLESITPGMLSEAFREYIDIDNYILLYTGDKKQEK